MMDGEIVLMLGFGFMFVLMLFCGFGCFIYGRSRGYAAGYQLGLTVADSWERRAKKAEASAATPQ